MAEVQTTRLKIPDWPDYPCEHVHYDFKGAQVELYHHGHDALSVRRLRIRWKHFVIVLLPTKGLSVLDCYVGGIPLFWDPPLERIEAPDKLNLAQSLLVGGEETPGVAWIAQFLGGVEMLGLDNWGMQYRDEQNSLHPLHGNVSNIPATEVTVEVEDEYTLKISGLVTVYDEIAVVPPQEGAQAKWSVNKSVVLRVNPDEMMIDDTITNVSPDVALPDWGYHVQLRPRPGCVFHIPSGKVRERFGKPLPQDFTVWKPAKQIAIREEHGHIHSQLSTIDGSVQSLLEYPDGTGIGVRFPHAPYTMSWNSCGGANGTEFLWPGEPHIPLIPKPWDGVGPEIGASDLDHGTNVDPDVAQQPLAPGESQRLTISIVPLTSRQIADLRNNIHPLAHAGMTDQDISQIATHVWRTAAHEMSRLEEYCDREAFVSCVRLLAGHIGRVAVAGVGTSGVAAKKLVHSLCCVEISAFFLNPADAVHGALGSLQEGDIVFLISKGGGTREILQLIPSLQAKKTTIIAITENPKSVLGSSCDLLLRVAIEREADIFNMLATTSTLSVIALFDALAIAAMQLTGFTKEQFSIIHPSGAVGDRLLQGKKP